MQGQLYNSIKLYHQQSNHSLHDCCRTWSVPSHVPFSPLYLRHVAPNGAQHREGRKVALNSLCQLLWLKNTLAMIWLAFYNGKWLRLSTVDLAWLSGRAMTAAVLICTFDQYYRDVVPLCTVISLHLLCTILFSSTIPDQDDDEDFMSPVIKNLENIENLIIKRFYQRGCTQY